MLVEGLKQTCGFRPSTTELCLSVKYFDISVTNSPIIFQMVTFPLSLIYLNIVVIPLKEFVKFNICIK